MKSQQGESSRERLCSRASPRAERAVVTFLARDHEEETFEMSSEEERALQAAIAEADSGRLISWEILREQLRRVP